MAQQKKKATSKAKAAPRRQNRKKRPIRREVGGILCALFALCVAVSYIEKEAFLVRHLSQLFRGLLGYGYYLTVPSLLLAAYILLFHRGRPVRLRLFCALVMPVLVGTLAHIAGSDMGNTSLSGAIPTLWASGIELTSGGVLSGALAFGLFKLLGTVASVIVLSLVLVICLLGALHLTIGSLIAAIRSHERLEYEEEEYEEVLPRRTKPVESKPISAPKAPIDIPLEGEKKKSAGAKSGFFAAKSDEVRTPDELLAPRKEEPLSVEPVGEKDAEKPPVAVEKPAAEKPVESKKIAANDLQAETEKVTGEIEQELAGEQSEYHYPPITLLEEGGASNAGAAGAELRNNSRRLADTLRSFGVDAKAGDVVRGPSVTRYEFTLDQGVKLSKITNLQDDIALALGASGVRIAPIPDKISVVGIEVPNKLVSAVRIRDVLESRDFVQHSSSVAFAVGKDIGGKNIVGNIAKLPHVLIAGTTGSGKSVCTNSLIVSLLYKSTPEDVRFIMVDPKMVELAPYNGIPHLLIPVVTDPKKAAGALQWAVYEMMKRYKMFSEHNVKDLAGYNALAGVAEDVKKLPSVVVVIDELADLMLVAAKEVEESICRVAQMGRAAGMHLVIATQRPSADVITGLMKANIPSRIAFAVASSLESRIILDNSGAEKLVGRGDMLYAPLGEGKPKRVQGCLISAEEIERVVRFVKDNGEASYSDEVMQKIEESVAEKERGGKNAPAPEVESADDGDELLPAAIDVVIETGQASVSMLQRRLKLGYSRAARLVDQMEQRGVVGPFEGSKPRQLLITKEKWQEIQMRGGLGAMSAAAMAEQSAEQTEE